MDGITQNMDKSLEALKHNFAKVRTGRANANVLADITVDYYGVPTPVTQVAGMVVRLPFPAPTEERRRELVKECRELAEQAKISIRNIRRDYNNKLERDEDLSEDDVRREQAKVQKHTDEYVRRVDELLKAKEAEVMEI